MEALLQQYNYDLQEVIWGYRDKFGKIIAGLVSAGFIGNRNKEVTETFFSFLVYFTGSNYDDTVNSFLMALDSPYAWILKTPHVFSQWCRTGERLVAEKHYAGNLFFNTSAQGGLGTEPAETALALTHINALLDDKIDLTLSLIRNFRNLAAALRPEQLTVFIQEAENIHRRSAKQGCEFMEGLLQTTDLYIQRITGEARLDKNREAIRRMIKAISGRTIEIDHLGKLDSDELYIRGTKIVGLSRWLYLPIRISDLSSYEDNCRFYKLIAVTYACNLLFNGFAGQHAEYGHESLEGYLKHSGAPESDLPAAMTMFELCEYQRITGTMRRQFPGVSSLLDWGTAIEFRYNPPLNPEDYLLREILTGSAQNAGQDIEDDMWIVDIAERSTSYADTARLICELLADKRIAIEQVPRLRRLAFWPDPGFTSEISMPSIDNTKAEISSAKGVPDPSDADAGDDETGGMQGLPSQQAEAGSGEEDDSDTVEKCPQAGFLYNEWNGIHGEYYRNWCFLQEYIPPVNEYRISASQLQDAETERIKRLFEKIKHDTVRKEKNLYSGDTINIERLVEYQVQRKARIIGKENFYEKPFVHERDLAVAILVDISGSTGTVVEKRLKILDLEKSAAAALADGLQLLGDQFGVFGFTGNGREQCQFAVFKDFENEWDQNARNRLASIWPGTSTRIGVALRHAGAKLAQVPCRRKLILLVSDGEPMDREYDPNTGYAHLDVRHTCFENQALGINTFAIITDDKHKDTFEQMFPFRNFIVIRDLMELPYRMSQFFTLITA